MSIVVKQLFMCYIKKAVLISMFVGVVGKSLDSSVRSAVILRNGQDRSLHYTLLKVL